MLAWVVILGCVLVWTAYCSAGRPKASQPIGCRTLIPAHPLVAADDVGGRVALGMADVQARPAGVRKHVEDVELGPGGIEVDRAEGLVPLPLGLPLGLDTLRVIRRHGFGSLTRDRRGPYSRMRAGPTVTPLTKKAHRGVRGAILAECPA